MSVNIFYNGTDFFSQNSLPTPNVSRNTENIIFGDKVGLKEVLTLSGQIYLENKPSDCDYLSALNVLRDSLLTFFSNDFKDIEIKEGSTSIFKRDFCKIISIDFPESNYVKVIEYSINIECYDESIHNEFFGISQPSNQTNIDLNEDGTYIITREISAVGENLQDGNLSGKNVSSVSSSMENAIDFVRSLSGKDNVNIPSEDPNIKIHLITNSESIDRVKNSFAISETYIADKNDTNLNHGILRYTIDREKDFGLIETANINGNLKFGKDTDFSVVRNRFKSIDFYEEVKNKLSFSDLIRHPLSVNISESEDSKEINFSFSFDNNDNFDSCGVSKNTNYSITESGNIINISVSGSIEARGPAENRWDLVSNSFYNSSYNSSLYSSWINESAQNEVNKYFSGITLYKYPENRSVTENKRAGKIEFEYSYTNKEKIEDFKSLSSSVSVSLPSPNYSIDMNYGGSMNKYIVSRSGFNKGTISINISGVYDSFTGNESSDRDTALQLLQNKANEKFDEISSDVFSSYSSVTTSMNKNYSKNSNSASFSETRNYYES